jgi:arylsulfatase A-like enzyme
MKQVQLPYNNGPILVPLIALITSLGLLFACSERPVARPPNIVLITVDTLRPDHLSPYDHERETTPFLQELAEVSVVFADTISQSGTTPHSLSSIMTGLFPHTDDLLRTNGPFVVLKRSATSLASVLREAGFRTHAITSSIQSSKVTGVGLGFETFDGIKVRRKLESSRRRIAMDVTHLAKDWLADQEAKPDPFFLWLHYLDPHHPYAPPSEYLERFSEDALDRDGETRTYIFDEEHSRNFPLTDRALRDLQLNYDREIAYLDDALRDLFESEARLTLKDSIVIFTADHGESLGEHRIITHNDLYQSIVRVPLLIRFPAGAHGGQRIEAPVMLVDLFPTLMAKLDMNPKLQLRGVDLSPAIERGDASALNDRLRLSEYGMPALYAGRFKLIERGERSELFDLSADPHEQRNLIATLPQHSANLRKRYSELKTQGPGALPSLPDPLPEITDEMRRELRALGYIDE